MWCASVTQKGNAYSSDRLIKKSLLWFPAQNSPSFATVSSAVLYVWSLLSNFCILLWVECMLWCFIFNFIKWYMIEINHLCHVTEAWQENVFNFITAEIKWKGWLNTLQNTYLREFTILFLDHACFDRKWAMLHHPSTLHSVSCSEAFCVYGVCRHSKYGKNAVGNSLFHVNSAKNMTSSLTPVLFGAVCCVPLKGSVTALWLV